MLTSGGPIYNEIHGFLVLVTKKKPTCEPVSSVENPGWLFDIGDYTTQLYGDYNKPI